MITGVIIRNDNESNLHWIRAAIMIMQLKEENTITFPLCTNKIVTVFKDTKGNYCHFWHKENDPLNLDTEYVYANLSGTKGPLEGS